ncbi:hypothetical protein AB0G02_26450 [Actinosynnema sp. NPDC023658]|uniref:protein kinase domain-containing protein n=1 Tax=Actinosynnema sp. NPDC023658 TaxID=3155465 RepID=UPI0033C4313E
MAEAFGPYRVEELLGRGGMGEVHRAHDTAHDRVVALKRLAPVHDDDEEFRARFRRESRIAARLREPHVIPIHAYGEIDGRLYLDMRLVEGRDLAAVLEGGPLDPARAVRLVAPGGVNARPVVPPSTGYSSGRRPARRRHEEGRVSSHVGDHQPDPPNPPNLPPPDRVTPDRVTTGRASDPLSHGSRSFRPTSGG